MSDNEQANQHAKNPAHQMQEQASPLSHLKAVHRFHDAAYHHQPAQHHHGRDSSKRDNAECDDSKNNQGDSQCEEPSPFVADREARKIIEWLSICPLSRVVIGTLVTDVAAGTEAEPAFFKPRREHPVRRHAATDQTDPDKHGKLQPARVRPACSRPKEDQHQALWRAVLQADPKRCLPRRQTLEYQLLGVPPQPETGRDPVSRVVLHSS